MGDHVDAPENRIGGWAYAGLLAWLTLTAAGWQWLHLTVADPSAQSLTFYLPIAPDLGVIDGLRLVALLTVGSGSFVVAARSRSLLVITMMALIAGVSAGGWCEPAPYDADPPGRLELIQIGFAFLPSAFTAVLLSKRAGVFGVGIASNVGLGTLLIWYADSPRAGPGFRAAVLGAGAVAMLAVGWLALIAPRANPATRRTSRPGRRFLRSDASRLE